MLVINPSGSDSPPITANISAVVKNYVASITACSWNTMKNRSIVKRLDRSGGQMKQPRLLQHEENWNEVQHHQFKQPIITWLYYMGFYQKQAVRSGQLQYYGYAAYSWDHPCYHARNSQENYRSRLLQLRLLYSQDERNSDNSQENYRSRLLQLRLLYSQDERNSDFWVHIKGERDEN